MKKAAALIFVLILFIIVYILLAEQAHSPTDNTVLEDQKSENNSQEKATSEEEFTANFEIYTHGTKRIFTGTMYHNLSDDVYLQSADPSIVHVKKQGITWADFFETLPMEITNKCLTTGLGEEFCTNDSNTLRFYLNNTEAPNALQREIQPNDSLKISYESR